MDSKEGAEVKSIIRSLLISNPLRSSAKQLWKDFQEMEGRPCPIQKFGFSTFEEYLRSIPDTVQVYGSGPFAEVEGIVSSKNKHINEMVLKQKTNVKAKRKKPINTYSRYSYPHHYSNQSVKPNYYPPSPRKPILKSVPPKEVFPNYNPIPITQSPVKSAPNFVIPKNESLPQYQVPTENIPKDVISKNESLPLGNFTKSNDVTPKTETLPFYKFVSEYLSKNVSPKKEPAAFNPFLHISDAYEPKLLHQQLQASAPSFQFKGFHNQTNTDGFQQVQQNVGPNFSSLPFFEKENNNNMGIFDTPLPAVKLDMKNYTQSDWCGKPIDDISDFSCEEMYEPSSADIDHSSSVPTKVQANLKKLIQQFPGGIECSKLPTEYRKMFNKKISYLDYSYRSIIDMCSDLPHIFHYLQQSSDDYVLYDKNRPLPPQNLKKYVPPEPTEVQTETIEEVEKIDISKSMMLIPPDVMTMADRIDRLFPSDLGDGALLDVCIGEIYDLSKFWIYLAFGDLEPLMKQLQTHFEKEYNRHLIPEVLLEEGLYGVSLYAGAYHRCVIVNVSEERPHIARVLYIDYGTVDNIATNEIWFLPKQFGNAPCQAIRARLSNICPVYENRPWTAAAVSKFEKLIAGKPLVAEVTKIHSQDHALDLYLADITDKDNIFYINDVLVKEEYAVYLDQPRKKSAMDYDCVPNVVHLHLYPEFFEIEAGLAPTTEEMRYICLNKIPMHHYLPQYFDIFYKEDIIDIQLQHENFNHRERKNIIIPTEVDEEPFDLCFFPECIADEIREVYEQENKTNLLKPQIKSTTQPCINETCSDDEKTANESVKEYSFTKKRILKLMHSNIDKDSLNRSESLTSCSSSSSPNYSNKLMCDFSSTSRQSQETALSDSLQSLNLKSDDRTPPWASTNPFLSLTNPFRQTNPFLCDLEENISKPNQFNLFSKSSESTLPQQIVNNLKDSHPCVCKKQVNKDKPLNNSTVEGTSNCSVATASPPKKLDKKEEILSPDVNPRVRTPPGFNSYSVQGTSNLTPNTPGFNSATVQNRVPYLPNLNVFNFNANNNPYYFRFSNPQFLSNTHISQNQMLMNLTQPFYNNIPPMFPNQQGFNLPNYQNFLPQQNFFGTPPRYP